MTTTRVPDPETESRTKEELLIKEARRRARHRRFAVVLAILVVIAAAIIVTNGGGHHPAARALSSSPASAPGVAGGSRASTPSGILSGQSVFAVSPVGPGTLWVQTGNETSLKPGGQGLELTTDGGRTWRNSTPAGMNSAADGQVLAPMFALSASRAWVVVDPASPQNPSTRQALWATTDGGRHWAKVGTIPIGFCAPQFWNPDDGICASSLGAGGSAPVKVAVTRDGGRTWHISFNNYPEFGGGAPNPVPANGLPFECDKQFSLTQPHTLWARFWCASAQAILYRSNDFGHTWSAASIQRPRTTIQGGTEFSDPIVMSGERGATALTQGDVGIIYVTTDGGRSFSSVYPPGTPHNWIVDVVTPEIWRLAWHHEIIGTDNAGNSWFSITNSAFTTKSLRSLQTHGSPPPTQMYLTSGTSGWVVWNQGTGKTVLVTHNGGRHWQRVSVPGTTKVATPKK